MDTVTPVLFSVVIPTYNRADLILQTIETVLTQTYPYYEIIVVDNCSTDNTEAVLQPLITAKKIRYIRNEKNFERAYSRNVGLNNAKGDFVTLLDSDDFMHSIALEDAADFIKRNSDIKVFHNLAQVVNNKEEVIYKTTYPSLSNQFKALCQGNFMSAIGGFIHKEVYRKYRFNEDPQMTGSEDYEFWFHIFAHYKIGRINKINSSIREHPQRSVNTDVYNHLRIQAQKIVTIIKNDRQLNEKFGPYLNTLKASFQLQEIIVNYAKYSFSKKLKLLAMAAKMDGSIILTKRFLSVLKNILLK